MWRWMLLLVLVLGTGVASAQSTEDQEILSRAVQAHESGNFAEAVAGYQAFLKAYPDASGVRSNLGAALAHEGRFGEAVEQYKQALAAAPSHTGVRFNLGLAYYKMGELSSAISEFEAVSSALSFDDPQNTRVKLLLAECYLAEGREDQAISLLNPVSERYPKDLAVAYLLGTALLHKGDEERGAQLIEQIMKLGDTAEVHMLLAYTKFKANDPMPGLKEVKRAIELNPNLPETYLLRARLEYITSDVGNAEASFKKALELDNNSFDAHLLLGNLLDKQGRTAEARPHIEHALLLRPNDIQAQYHYARLCSEDGDDKRAAELLEAVLKTNPEYTEAHRMLSVIDFRLGRVEEGRRERKISESLNAQIALHDQERGRNLPH